MKVMENFKRNNIIVSINSAANLFHIGGIRYSNPEKTVFLNLNGEDNHDIR